MNIVIYVIKHIEIFAHVEELCYLCIRKDNTITIRTL